jgi:hypothetical protein
MALFFEWAQTPADRGPLTKARKKCGPRRRIHARQWAWAWTWYHNDRLDEAVMVVRKGALSLLAVMSYRRLRPLRPRVPQLLR